MIMPTTFMLGGVQYDRVTIKFLDKKLAGPVRGYVHDALIRAHGLSTATGLTIAMATSGARFRVAIARAKVRVLKKRLKLLVRAGLIELFIAGQRVTV